MTDPTASTAPSGPWLVGRIDAALRPRLAEVAARTATLRRRLWAQAALDRLVLALAAASLVASVAALLVRTGWTTAETDAWWLTALGALLADLCRYETRSDADALRTRVKRWVKRKVLRGSAEPSTDQPSTGGII